MSEKITKSVPYNQNYTFAYQFIGGAGDQVLFTYLWDMYVIKYRCHQSPYVELNLKKIQELRTLDPRTVKRSIAHLEEIGLVIVDGRFCTINARRYISLAHALYYYTQDNKDAEQFIAAINRHDDEWLKRYGFNEDAINVDERCAAWIYQGLFLISMQKCRIGCNYAE